MNIQIRILAVVPNLVQDSAVSKRILTKLKGSVPMVTPFEMRKRVMLQATWSSGCSIFAYQVLSKTDEHTKQEIMEHYRELAKLVMERAAEGGIIMAENRIDKLAEPFRTHAPAASGRLTSLYLDGEVVSRLDKAYRDCN